MINVIYLESLEQYKMSIAEDCIKVYPVDIKIKNEVQLILDLRVWNEKTPTMVIDIEFPNSFTSNGIFRFEFKLSKTSSPLIEKHLYASKSSIELLLQKDDENKIQTIHRKDPFILEVFEKNSTTPKFQASFFRVKSKKHTKYQDYLKTIRQQQLPNQTPPHLKFPQKQTPLQVAPTKGDISKQFRENNDMYSSTPLNSTAISSIKPSPQFNNGIKKFECFTDSWLTESKLEEDDRNSRFENSRFRRDEKGFF